MMSVLLLVMMTIEWSLWSVQDRRTQSRLYHQHAVKTLTATRWSGQTQKLEDNQLRSTPSNTKRYLATSDTELCVIKIIRCSFYYRPHGEYAMGSQWCQCIVYRATARYTIHWHHWLLKYTISRSYATICVLFVKIKYIALFRQSYPDIIL